MHAVRRERLNATDQQTLNRDRPTETIPEMGKIRAEVEEWNAHCSIEVEALVLSESCAIPVTGIPKPEGLERRFDKGFQMGWDRIGGHVDLLQSCGVIM